MAIERRGRTDNAPVAKIGKRLRWGILAAKHGEHGKTVDLKPEVLPDPEYLDFDLEGCVHVKYKRTEDGVTVKVKIGPNEYVVSRFPDRTAARLRKLRPVPPRKSATAKRVRG